MRALALAAAVAVVAATLALACDDALQFALRDNNEFTKMSLNAIDGGSTVRACLQIASGRQVDWYFTSNAAADQWRQAAFLHYATSNTPYSQPPSVVYQSRLATAGFEHDFDVSSAQAEAAGKDFAVIIHATSQCFGSGNSCTGEASMHMIVARPIWVIIVIVVVIIAVIACIIGCCCYCCRKKPADAPPQQQGEQVQVQPANTPQPQPTASEDQQPADPVKQV
eukprot:CAMPEP_0174826812 /NCGR_PEP_ID=MMETSP1114-20130205/251_1 /TAXON_ID=312471 /ORGANISM="Neobodo designis, Strain CCAP 1951/1" /LENGTH=223 /DNA_ID=CAMNT_0016060379 /DNA_START=66 /DNA_END=737 /DNA_ORIENTATION=-